MKNKNLIIGIVVVAVAAIIYLYAFSGTPDIVDGGSDVANTDLTMTASYMDVSAAEAKGLIDTKPELIVIDVSPYWANGHLPRAVNYYPISTLQTAVDLGEIDANAEYLIYCHADGPSRSGAQVLIDAGFENVYRLESHFSGWQAAGYPIEQ